LLAATKLTTFSLKNSASLEERFLITNRVLHLVITHLPVITTTLRVIAQSTLPRWFSE